VDAIITDSKTLVLALFVVIMANPKAIVRVDLEEIHLLVLRFAQQVIHLMLVRRIRAPVSARCECLADDQSSGGEIGLGSGCENPVEITLEVRRAPYPIRYLRWFDDIRLDFHIAGRARQSDLHSTLCCNRK